MFHLKADPDELLKLYGTPESKKITAELKAEIARLKIELKVDDQFANEIPKDVDDKIQKWAPRFGPEGPMVPPVRSR